MPTPFSFGANSADGNPPLSSFTASEPQASATDTEPNHSDFQVTSASFGRNSANGRKPATTQQKKAVPPTNELQNCTIEQLMKSKHWSAFSRLPQPAGPRASEEAKVRDLFYIDAKGVKIEGAERTDPLKKLEGADPFERFVVNDDGMAHESYAEIRVPDWLREPSRCEARTRFVSFEIRWSGLFYATTPMRIHASRCITLFGEGDMFGQVFPRDSKAIGTSLPYEPRTVRIYELDDCVELMVLQELNYVLGVKLNASPEKDEVGHTAEEGGSELTSALHLDSDCTHTSSFPSNGNVRT